MPLITSSNAAYLARRAVQARVENIKRLKERQRAILALEVPLPIAVHQSRCQAQLEKLDGMIERCTSPQKLATLLTCKKRMLEVIRVIIGPAPKPPKPEKRRRDRDPEPQDFGPVGPQSVAQ